jgi:hypothetical protein
MLVNLAAITMETSLQKPVTRMNAAD